jgi:hypothetical protein
VPRKIIYTTIRFVSPAELEWYLDDCIALKREFPHLIAGRPAPLSPRARILTHPGPAGFDLVGPENSLKPLADYLAPLLAFRARTRALALDIPFIFHAGETLGDGSMADVNLYDAVLLGTKRIGHGCVPPLSRERMGLTRGCAQVLAREAPGADADLPRARDLRRSVPDLVRASADGVRAGALTRPAETRFWCVSSAAAHSRPSLMRSAAADVVDADAPAADDDEPGRARSVARARTRCAS